MILLDGPMGTEIERRGVETPPPGWSAYALQRRPAIVAEIHRAYAAADVHRTNTFRVQPRVFPLDYEELARVAIRLAREAAPAKRVAGSIAPVMDCYRPDLSPPPDVARADHRARVASLRGCDLLVCEAFPHPGEARIAVEEAARSGLPVWIALTAGPDGDLLSPEALERAARDCVAAGASAVLVNCTAATKTLAYVARLARIGVPFGAYANAGDPASGLGAGTEGAAERYAALADAWLREGATIVGACCGCGPEHVAELARRRSAH